jgi:hypothetical protein
LAALARRGLVAAHRLPTSPAHLHVVTPAGLRLAGLSSWTAPRWRWSQFRHEHTAVEIALDLLHAGWEVVPDRRMRQEDALGVATWSLVVPTERAGARSHYPDLMVRPTNGAADGRASWRAVEVELARKSLPRLVGILSAYRDRQVGVTYYTADRHVADAVRRAAERAGLNDLDVRRTPAPASRRPADAGVGRG